MIKIDEETKKMFREGFTQILRNIEKYHDKFDEILKDTTDTEKAFVLGTYLMNMKLREEGKEVIR